MLLRWIINAFLLLLTTDYVLCRNPRNRRSNDYVPCKNGWHYFKDKCYQVSTDRQNWETAANMCSQDGGSLVTISSKDEQEFINSLIMLEIRESVWIGLHDRVNESEYSWHDGSTSDYRNWQPNEPSGFSLEHEDCVQIVIDLYYDKIGQWNDNSCERHYSYICQMKPDPEKYKSPNPRYCSSEVGGGFRFRQDCYHLVMTMKSWEEAQKHCNEMYKGNLITILDNTVDFYLDYLLKTCCSHTDMWMGIKIQDRFQQKWTSGWYVGYNGFKSEHRDFFEGTCVVRTKRKEWKIVPCSKKYSFICEISKVVAPVLKPPIKGSYCPKVPEKWRDLDGEYCYFIETNDHRNWHEANFICMRRGGYLASIHSKEERDLLLPFIQYTQKPAFIGMYKLLDPPNKFRWTDNSDMDFYDWYPSEPNGPNETCVEVRSNDLRWNDVSCDNRIPYICSVKKIAKNIAVNEDSDNQTKCSGSISIKALIGVVVCIIVLIFLLGVVIYFFGPCYVERRKNSTATGLAPSSPAINRPKYRSADPRSKEQESLYEEMSC